MTVEGSSGMVTTVTSRGGDDGRATSVVLEATRLQGDSRLPCCEQIKNAEVSDGTKPELRMG